VKFKAPIWAPILGTLQIESVQIESVQIQIESVQIQIESVPIQIESIPIQIESVPIQIESVPMVESVQVQIASVQINIENVPLVENVQVQIGRLGVKVQLESKLCVYRYAKDAGGAIAHTVSTGRRRGAKRTANFIGKFTKRTQFQFILFFIIWHPTLFYFVIMF